MIADPASRLSGFPVLDQLVDEMAVGVPLDFAYRAPGAAEAQILTADGWKPLATRSNEGGQTR